MTKFKALMLAGALALASATAAEGAGFFTNGVPPAGGTQYPSTIPLTGNETIPADTNLPSGLNPASEAITTAQMAGYMQSVAGTAGFRNALIGGDFGTNLWQRGTTSASITTALLYGPDRWWGLSGTGTAFTVIKQTASQPTGFAGSARVQRTASQTGVLPVCVGQVLTQSDSTRFQGKTAEFRFLAKDGANFSASGANVTATIAYGTGASEDTAANFSTGSWTGYTAINQTVALTTSWGLYSVVGSVPSTATQIGVKICYTPVGTAGANDWFEFTGAQLDVNSAAVASTGVSGTAYNVSSFEHRPLSVEGPMQYRYFYRLSEPASGAGVNGICQATGASTNACTVNMPVVMRGTTPTITITTAGTFKVNIAGTPTTIATPTASTCSSAACAVTAANTNTAGQAELLTGGGGSGAWDISSEL